MEELLIEYYGLDIDYSKKYQGGLIFFVNGDYYYLCKNYLSKEEVNESYELAMLLKSKGVLLHDFVFNNNGDLLSGDYILLKLNYLIENVDITDLRRTNLKVDSKITDNFYDIWTNKIDYYEEKLFIEENNTFIGNSFDYFVGISEMLLELYKMNKTTLESNYIVHRSFYSLNTIDYYNPLNIVVGNSLKDYSSFVRLTNNWDLLYELLNNVSYEEKVYLFVRLAFPLQYFYYLNNMLNEKECSNKILSIINDISKYEEYLSKLEDVVGIRLFYWIKKDN